MMKITSLGITAAAGLVLAACAGDPSINREAEVSLDPMAKPASVPADVQVMSMGEPTLNKLVSIDGEMITRMIAEGHNAGCTYTFDGWFAPASKYETCGGYSGAQEVTKAGDIWPLAVGKTETYEIKGTNGTNSWQDTRRCEVEGAVLVTLQEKALPAYEVVCKDRSSTRTWYVSPELQQVVKYKRYRSKRGLVDDVELVLE